MWFGSLDALVRVFIVGIVAYGGLILLLRLTGKRTLTKLNAFDLVITVALGSTLSSAIISKGVPLAQGLFALTLLVLLQYAVTWTQIRSNRVQRWIKATPRDLLRDGAFEETALREERVTRQEVEAAVRGAGYWSLADIGRVVLETDGSLSVIPQSRMPKP